MSKNKNWYSIKTAAADDGTNCAEVYIFDYIGYWDISARSFIDELQAIDADQIDLHINSPGGAVFDGVAIQNSIKHHKANVTVYIDGIAGSIASIIALAGDQVMIADNAYVMIHNPSSIVWGEAADMIKEAEVLDKLADGLAGDYARQMDITIEEARALMDAETWYLGQEAVDAGYADSTFAGTQAAASFDLKRFSAKAPKAAIERFSAKAPKAAIERFTQSPRGDEPNATVDPKEKPMAKATTPKADTDTEPTTDPATDTDVDPGTQTETSEVSEVTEQDVEAAVEAALDKEAERVAGITALANKFGFTNEAETFIGNRKKTVAEFQAHILNKSPDDWKASLAIKNPSTQESEADLDASKEGSEAVSKIKERRKAAYGA